MIPGSAAARLLVAPRAGAWIEIDFGVYTVPLFRVAPRAGAWIEIDQRHRQRHCSLVAPRAGAWIEMLILPSLASDFLCRSPCGSVDVLLETGSIFLFFQQMINKWRKYLTDSF